jgi:hypothetical protein
LQHPDLLENRFLKVTGALAVLGYRSSIDWVESAAFELLVLAQLQYGALTVGGLNAAR